MVRKPGKMYTQTKGKAYCRREYMGGVPANRIVQYDIGNPKGDFPVVMTLQVDETCQIRHTALEAARIAANKHIQKFAGSLGYHLKVRVYPHHVIRENKMATGAGADRVSSGMRLAFGKAVGTAARMKRGQKIMTLRTSNLHFEAAKEALYKGGYKLPTPVRVLVEKAGENA
jgi:large subunit ribosomal protein L10e